MTDTNLNINGVPENQLALLNYLKAQNQNDTDFSINDIIKSNYDNYGLETFDTPYGEYAIGDYNECNETCKEYIKNTAWAFNADFIIEHCKALDYDDASHKVINAIQEQCESGNDAILKLIDDFDEFAEDAISADGRGHFLSGYDGDEIELENGFYAYRVS